MMVRSYITMPRPSDMIYAPIDLAIATAKGLAARGHQVTIFSPIGTEIYGQNISVENAGIRSLIRNQADFNKLLDDTELLAHGLPVIWDGLMASKMFKRADEGEFDLLHFHHPESALLLASEHPKIPVVYTLHDPIYHWYKELFEMFASKNQHFMSISKNQRRDAPDLPYLANVYNGVNVELFSFSEQHEEYLLFSGRITQEKGVKEAIEVAKATKHKLLIIGPVNHGSQEYFDQFIKPELNEHILYLGRMDKDQLVKYYQKAKALLTPVQWEEPFGLTTIEAMACGTPVISLSRGAAPEIIVDKKTGFIVNSISEMIKAVDKIDRIKRLNCRARVEKEFSNEHMVDSYEKAFYKALAISPDIAEPSSIILDKIKQVQKTIVKKLPKK
jgi:glycosyltransferase involved in cell wall biosynthesis